MYLDQDELTRFGEHRLTGSGTILEKAVQIGSQICRELYLASAMIFTGWTHGMVRQTSYHFVVDSSEFFVADTVFSDHQ